MIDMKSVRAVPGRLVSDIDALAAGLRRFIGCEFDRELKQWRPTNLPVFIDASRAEYKRAIKAGDLLVLGK